MKDQLEEAAKYTAKQLTYSVDRAYDRGVYSGKRMMKEKIEGLILKWESLEGQCRSALKDAGLDLEYANIDGARATLKESIKDIKALLK